ncbi:MAG: hypothetical protein ABJV04_10210 [Aliiglaciecola sp.]
MQYRLTVLTSNIMTVAIRSRDRHSLTHYFLKPNQPTVSQRVPAITI